MKLSPLLVACALTFAASGPVFADVFAGNGSTGFGGTIGNGSLTVTSTTDGKINFTLNTGTNFNGNALVIYIDSQAGGLANTSTLSDTADGGRTAISGVSGSGRTLANFSPGFGADYAISVEPPSASFAGLFSLTGSQTALPFVASGGLTGSGTTFNFSFNESAFGLIPGQSFTFEASLISTSAYRSNETFGMSATVPGTAGDTPNAGFTGTTTFASGFTYTTAVPEPMQGVYLGLGLTVAAGFYRRLRSQ